MEKTLANNFITVFWPEARDDYTSRLPLNIDLGTDFRITDRSAIRFGAEFGAQRNWHIGANHEIPLTNRSSIWLHSRFQNGRSVREVERHEGAYNSPIDVENNQHPIIRGESSTMQEYSNNFSKVTAGAKFKVRIANNLDLRAGVDFGRKFNVSTAGDGFESQFTRWREQLFIPETRNTFNVSVGLHKSLSGLAERHRRTVEQQQGNFQRWTGHPARHQGNPTTRGRNR